MAIIVIIREVPYIFLINTLAIKIYNRLDSGRRSDRIFAEKEAMQRMNSPYIIRLYSTSKDDNYLYFHMEVGIGGSLHKQLRHNFGINETVAYASELASAIFHMGTVGVVHRDIKLSNCLLDANGHLKLCDFGSSKVLFDIADCQVPLIST